MKACLRKWLHVAFSLIAFSGALHAQTVTFGAPAGQIVALESSVAGCVRGAAILPFQDEMLQVDGVRYVYTPNPPMTFVDGAAVAALYVLNNTSGQVTNGQFCVDGACLANGNSCSAIAFVQPNTVRIYVRQ